MEENFDFWTYTSLWSRLRDDITSSVAEHIIQLILSFNFLIDKARLKVSSPDSYAGLWQSQANKWVKVVCKF